MPLVNGSTLGPYEIVELLGLERHDELAVIVPSLFVSVGLVLYGRRGFASE